MGDSSTNLSKIKREHLLDICSRIKNKDDVDITEIVELEQFIKSMKYGLTFEQHEEPVDAMLRTHIPVFKEFKEVIGNPDSSDCNFLLEGDNLHSLKLLERTHKGRIDVIAIDPPYNTGKEFTYGDNIVSDEDGYKHSKWLSFMKERLEIVKKLLTNNGFVFINIDEHEYSNLKLLCDMIFGTDNVETIIWNKVPDFGTAGSGKMKITYRFRTDHEYILVCYKNKKITFFDKPLKIPNWKTQYSNQDNDYRGPWCDGELCKSEKKSNPEGKNYYSITTPSGKNTYTRQWHCTYEEFQEYIKDNRIWWGANGENCPRLKKFQELPQPTTPTSIIKNISQTDGNNDFDNIFGKSKNRLFDNPKPIDLIKELLRMSLKKDITILDFFAGSGTTGHAVMELNQEDGGKRKFILCTNNETSASRTLDYIKSKGYMKDVKVSEKNNINQSKIDKFFEENPDVYQELMVDNKLEYETYGICQSVTYPRLSTVITGIRPDGTKHSDGIKTNLRYFQTDMIDKQNADLDELLYEASFCLAQLEHMTAIDGVSVCTADCDEDVDEIIENASDKLNVVFVADDVLLDNRQKEFFNRHNVDVKRIPNYYYKEL